ncbi:MAG TPA: dihydropyrimidinase [Brevefilum sp.]|nr:dihydropyrimidinase [Brevefilum sp.]HOR18721.1 dihydropyrimidinase [Brevefilum sp.]HPL68622.1 dihydropyrimidinase [Brevefilum sp.]
MTTIIKNGTLITASETYQADILIEGERISLIGQDLSHPNAEVVDASGLLVLPGGIDPHVHLDLPMFDTVSSDDHYTGGKAAAFGGTTTVIDFVPQDEGTLADNIARWRAKADPRAAVDFGFHMNITRFNQDVAREIFSLPDLGITSLKVFTAYNQRLRLSDGEIFRVMRLARSAGILTMVHAENGDVIDILVDEALAAGNTAPIFHAKTRPAWGTVEASLRAAALAAQAGDAPLYLVHMNTAGELNQLVYAREHGLKMMGETCPQYLFFTEEDLRREDGAKWVCSPPVRKPTDNLRLWEGIEGNTIQVVATDHCPFFYDGATPIIYEGQPVAIAGKELGRGDFTRIPNGLPGLGDRMPIMWTEGVGRNRMTPNQFVAMHCTNPARIFGLYPRKGALIPGADADIVLWDPNKELTYGVNVAHHRTDYNLYEDWQLRGFPVVVFLRGQKIVDGENWYGEPGGGRYLNRNEGEILT